MVPVPIRLSNAAGIVKSIRDRETNSATSLTGKSGFVGPTQVNVSVSSGVKPSAPGARIRVTDSLIAADPAVAEAGVSVNVGCDAQGACAWLGMLLAIRSAADAQIERNRRVILNSDYTVQPTSIQSGQTGLKNILLFGQEITELFGRDFVFQFLLRSLL